MPLDFEVFGRGIYTPREAARILGCSPVDVRRWTRGSGTSEPLWSAYYQDLDETSELSFEDLVELRTVLALRKVTSLQAIRFSYEEAKIRFGVQRPFSSLEFKTDGKEILAKIPEIDDSFLSLSKKAAGQSVFGKIIEQSLKGLEYEDGQAARWRPVIAKFVVIDPRRQFGEPIDDEYGVSTRTILADFNNFGDIKYLENIYEIPAENIRDALKFEKNLDKQFDGKGAF